MEVQRIPKRIVSVIEPQKSILVDKEKYHQKRVAAYCRVSTDSEEQLTSYQNQMRVYTEMIAANKEWEFAGLYADEGISGTRADKRPEFQRMIRDCQNGKIDYIITKSVSRFARNTVECLEYIRSLKAQGIGIFFEEQNIDTLKSDSELYLVIYAGFAQSESESISKHITWTYRKNFEDGKVSFQYKRLLGYRKGEDGKPEIVPEEAAIVERIFEMFLAGQPVGLIAQMLQSENIEIPGKDLSFSKNMIMNILRNEKYCGDSILQKTVTVDCISKTRKANHGEAPMYLVENSHPAIISRDIFHRTQEELARRKALRPKSDKTSITQSGKYSKYALSEVLHCAECGSRYKRVTWNIRGKKKIVWRCVSRLDYGKKYCKDSVTVEEAALHGAVVRALNRFHAEDESTYLTLMKATIGEAIGINGGSEEIDLLTRRIDTLNKRMLDLVNETVAAGKDVESSEIVITDISGVNSTKPELIDEVKEAEIITTAVGVRILPIIAPSIAEGIKARKENGSEEYLNIIACENAVKASSQLKEAVYGNLNDEEKAYADKYVGFPDCSVDRIVPPVRLDNPIDVVVENYYEWNVEEASFKGAVPQIEGMNLADNLMAYIERKLFTLNTGHCITAYLGNYKGYKTIDESIADDEIFKTVKKAMQQSGMALVNKYGFDKDAHFKYIDKILNRFKNPYLVDDTARVGREPLRKLSATDRLTKPTMTALEYGLPVDALLAGMAAALKYDNAEDPQSVELQDKIKANGVKAALKEVSGITDEKILDDVVAIYEAM